MHNDLKQIFANNTSGLLHDALGAMSLCVTFVAVLYLPGLF
ncbi:MAG: hypothetical protein PHX82_13910 [Paracoccaceae bacterium]|jgi:hypothetical protein|nr:hypothetical protein [Paracoccaceae bacterium]